MQRASCCGHNAMIEGGGIVTGSLRYWCGVLDCFVGEEYHRWKENMIGKCSTQELAPTGAPTEEVQLQALHQNIGACLTGLSPTTFVSRCRYLWRRDRSSK
jgi:hypothetical protein